MADSVSISTRGGDARIIPRAEWEAMTAEQRAAWQAGRKLVERMQGQLLGRARRARDLVQVQHEKGASSLLELLDAQRTYLAVHAESMQDLSLYWTALAQLEAAVGRELRP